MQNVIDTVMGNLPFFLGLGLLVILVIGLGIALSKPAGRDTLGTAAVRFAVFVLSLAEKWLGREIIGEKLAAINASQAPAQHPIISAQLDLQAWLDR